METVELNGARETMHSWLNSGGLDMSAVLVVLLIMGILFLLPFFLVVRSRKATPEQKRLWLIATLVANWFGFLVFYCYLRIERPSSQT